MIISTLFTLILIFHKSSTVSDEEYTKIPNLFLMDNYDQCFLQKNPLYCSFEYHLTPFNSSNKYWEIIEELRENPENYDHSNLRHWICVRNHCKNITINTSSLLQDLNDCYNDIYKGYNLTGSILKLKCSTSASKYEIDGYDIAYLIFVLLYVTFLIVASLCSNNKSNSGIIAAFAIQNNWKRLTSPQTNPNSKRLKCMQGIRFYNMVCVILCHTIMASLAFPTSNTKFPETMNRNALNMLVANGSYAVQTFFLMSGWLLSYNFFQMSKSNFAYVPIAFLHRYIRLVPVLGTVLGFHATWLVHLNNGPVWDKLVGEEFRNCRKNWWTNLLFVNNYIDKENMCLQQTWYLAADTQLYLVSLVILFSIKNFKVKKVFGALSICTVIGIMIPGIVSFTRNSDILIRQYPESLYNFLMKNQDWHYMYSSGYSNAGGYLIGMSFGYIYYKIRDQAVTHKRLMQILWWIVTFGLCLFVVLIAGVMYKPGFTFTRLGAALYWSMGRNLFALGVAVGILGISFKLGGPVRRVTEWEAVQVLGRLTFSAYLVHVGFVKVRVGLMRSPIFLDPMSILMSTLGDIVLAYLLAAVLCLGFEMPISALQKKILPETRTKNLETETASLKQVMGHRV